MDFRDKMKVVETDQEQIDALRSIRYMQMEIIGEDFDTETFDDIYGGLRRFHPLIFNNYVLSIQANKFMYCEPRKTLGIEEYTHMEFCLKSREHEYLNIKDDKFFNGFQFKNILKHCFDGMVYSMVPVEVIQSLFDYILNKGENLNENTYNS